MKRRPQAGMTWCLGGCNKQFFSKDKVSLRICPHCEKRRDRKPGPRVYPVRSDSD